MTDNFTLRKADKEDLPQISRFRKVFFGDNPLRSCEPEYYEWKCYHNPVQEGEIWLAEDDNCIVAMTSMIPKRLKILGSIVTGAETGDNFTHPGYQRRGLFTGLFQAARERGLDQRLDFIYGFPNNVALAGYEKKLNYARTNVTVYTLVKPVFSKQILKKKLSSPFFAIIASSPLDIVSKALLWVGTRGKNKSRITVSHVDSFPGDIDNFWKEVAPNYDVVLVRDKQYLDWRYTANPDTYSISLARDRENRILGYIVTKIAIDRDIPLGFIADFLTVGNNPDVFRQLLVSAYRELSRKKVNVISTWAVKESFYYRTLLKLGFFPRTRMPLICLKNELGNKILGQRLRWHITMADSDNI